MSQSILNDLNKRLKANFLKDDTQSNTFQQTYLKNYLNSAKVSKHIKTVPISIDLNPKDWQDIKFRQILAPVFLNKFFMITDLAPVDLCYYRSIIEMIYEKSKKKHDENTELYKKNNQYFSFYNQNDFFKEIKSYYKTNKDEKWCLYLNISDFYPRIYHHRLENILLDYMKDKNENSKKHLLVGTLMNMLKSLNKKQSYGIPIGPDCSKNLAEIFLFSLDEQFLHYCNVISNGQFKYYRYSDTFFIIFDKKEQNARMTLQNIAQIFINNNNFNFQSNKSEIIKLSEFIEKLIKKEENSDKIKINLENKEGLDSVEGMEDGLIQVIKEVDSYHFIELCSNLKIEDVNHLQKLYKIFSCPKLHILDLWFKIVRKYLDENNETIKNDVLEYIEGLPLPDYDFYKIIRDHLIIDFGTEFQLEKIKIPENNAIFYYPNYIVQKYKSTNSYEEFFSMRYGYNDWNTWKKIAYLLIIPRMTRNNEFEHAGFTNERNTEPFLIFKKKKKIRKKVLH